MAENNSDGGEAVQSYISNLSNELLIEILCRLGSSKYATQCKCICKRWLSLISSAQSHDSYFLSRWRKIHQEDEREQPIALLTQYPVWAYKDYANYDCDTYREKNDSIHIKYYHAIDYLSLFNNDLVTFNPLNFLHDNNIVGIEKITPIYVVATSKDLVLCSPNHKDHSVYYVCNPFTKQWVALPPYPLPPDNNIYSVQVGFAVSNDDEYGNDLKFKVVRLFPQTDDELDMDMVKVETFSSEDSSCMWRERYISVPVFWYYPGVVSYDGMLVSRSTYPGIERIILSTANYTLLPLPVGYEELSKSSHIGVCMGSLRMGLLVYSNPPFINLYSDNVSKLVIWELDKHSLDWETVHELDFCEVVLRGDEYLEESSSTIAYKWCFGTILAFHPRDRDILYLRFVLDNNTAVTCSCNIKERTVEMIRKVHLWEWNSEVFPLEMPSWPTTIPLRSFTPT